jgi:murein DD-endopeptidase MepM/ murein hydrolase activator NlpD
VDRKVKRAERIRRAPKNGWRNLLTRHLVGLPKRPAATGFLDYQPQTTLRLPFAGEWYVFWGGRLWAQNDHVVGRDQRFAYDLLMLARGNASPSHRGAGDNSDYYCCGQPIYAPADGDVVKAKSDLPDNTPGEMNAKSVRGHYVILDHGCDEFSFFAHFRQGTVVVRSGDQVRCGQCLAECGNSGLFLEPHLRYPMQNTSAPLRGDGPPAFFVERLANGRPVACGEPVARQTLRSQREFSRQ